MSMPVIAAARVQSWNRKRIKQHLLSSVWDKISNRWDYNQAVPKGGTQRVPDAVVMKVTDDFKAGEYKTTMISIRKPAATVGGGNNPQEGREYYGSMKAVSLFYNVQRVSMKVRDASVPGRISDKFWQAAEAVSDTLSTIMVEQTDYDHQRATVQGADVFLTEAEFWENAEEPSEISHPLDTVLHPNWYVWVDSALTKNTWSATYATAVSNLETVLDNMDSADIFNVACLDAVYLRASRYTARLQGVSIANGKLPNTEVMWVLKMGDSQWSQLVTDSTFKDLLKYTESGIEAVVTGFMGVYKGMMIVVDQRSPLALIGSDTCSFQYVTPAADNRTPTAYGASPSSTNAATAEIAVLYGAGALGMAEVQEQEIDKKSFDYGFREGMCVARWRGVRRVDLDTTDAATSARINETSFIVSTATTAGVITT